METGFTGTQAPAIFLDYFSTTYLNAYNGLIQTKNI